MRDREIVGLHQAYLDVYSNLNYNQDIVEVATEYFYTYGLNEDGIDILIEKVGLDNFVEFVYDLSEDLTILTEARSAKRRTGSESYADVKAKIDAKEAAKKEAKAAALKRKESERVEPGADTESKKEQPKSKKPIRDAIAGQILAGMERHRQATQTAGSLAGKTGRTLGRIASLASQAGRRAGEHVKKHGMKSLANSYDPFDTILEYLVAEGYADTNESALAIMANMSEEWRQSIVLDERNRGEQGMSDREVSRRRNLGGNTRSTVSSDALGDHGSQGAIQKFHNRKGKLRQSIHKSGRNTRGDTGESGGKGRYEANKDHTDGYPSITKRGQGPG